MILQCNLNKNQSIMNNILNDSHAKKFIILAFQEYWSWYMKSSLIYQSWIFIESIITTIYQSWSIIYINNIIIISINFESMHFLFNDITIIKIIIWSNLKSIFIINIYNSSKQNFIISFYLFMLFYHFHFLYISIYFYGDLRSFVLWWVCCFIIFCYMSMAFCVKLFRWSFEL